MSCISKLDLRLDRLSFVSKVNKHLIEVSYVSRMNMQLGWLSSMSRTDMQLSRDKLRVKGLTGSKLIVCRRWRCNRVENELRVMGGHAIGSIRNACPR